MCFRRQRRVLREMRVLKQPTLWENATLTAHQLRVLFQERWWLKRQVC
jgi:hypothetical protein